MKKPFSILAVAGLFVTSTSIVSAKAIAGQMSAALTTAAVVLQEEAPAAKGFTQVLKEQFIQGGASFMGIVLLCLILGLAVAIERIIFLNMATTNTTKLKEAVEAALKSGGVEAAKDYVETQKDLLLLSFTKD